MGRTIGLELVNWADQHEKGIAAKILVMDAMSSKESCYRQWQWRLLKSEKILFQKTWVGKLENESLDKAYKKS